MVNILIRKMWRGILRLYYINKPKLCRLMRIIPASPQYIMFESEIDYAESARAISDYMIENGYTHKYHLVWSVQNPQKYPKYKGVTYIKRDSNSIRWNFYLNRCGYFVFTHPYWLKEWKKDQYVINVWHGNPFKAPDVKRLSNVFDVMLANSEDVAFYRRREFDGDFDIAILGAPRNDWLYQNSDILKGYTGVEQYEKVILCMPTYRSNDRRKDGRIVSPYFINVITTEEELVELNDYLAKRKTLLICVIHHLQKTDQVMRNEMSHILYTCDEDYASLGYVMNNLLAEADALITDCSGVFLDFILLDRPIGFFCNEIGAYTRGFAMKNPEEYMAGEKIYTIADLFRFIDHVVEGEDDFSEFRRNVRNRVHLYQDNQNCKRFLEYFHIRR